MLSSLLCSKIIEFPELENAYGVELRVTISSMFWLVIALRHRALYYRMANRFTMYTMYITDGCGSRSLYSKPCNFFAFDSKSKHDFF